MKSDRRVGHEAERLEASAHTQAHLPLPPLFSPHCSSSLGAHGLSQLLPLCPASRDGCCLLCTSVSRCPGISVGGQSWVVPLRHLGHSRYQVYSDTEAAVSLRGHCSQKAGVENLAQFWGRYVPLRWGLGDGNLVVSGPLFVCWVAGWDPWCNNIVSDKNTMTGQEGERTRKPLQGRGEKLSHLSNFHFSFLPLFGQGPHSFILHEAPQALHLTLPCLGAVGRVLDEQAPESSGPVGASGGVLSVILYVSSWRCWPTVRFCSFGAGGLQSSSPGASLHPSSSQQNRERSALFLTPDTLL